MMFENKVQFAVLMLSLSTVACINPGKMTGGGKLVGEEGNTAHFGFNGNTCDGDLLNPTGHFNYIDQDAGVKMNGDLDAAGLCVSPDQWEGEWTAEDCLVCESLVGLPSYLMYFNYKSTNPFQPGEGQGFACMRDNGEGAGSQDDAMFVSVFSGPFAGYSQLGMVQGNIQEHACDDSED